MSEASKTLLTKILAILGFCVTVALIIWLIITAVTRAPGAFDSLADMADTIDRRSELGTLTVTPEKSVVNSGEPFTLSWTDTKHAGTYQIGHTCAEGMTVFFRDPEGTFRPMRCGDELLALPPTLTQLGLIASSTKDRFADVSFRVLFSESSTSTPIEGVAKVTVVNATLPTIVATTTTTPASQDDAVDTAPHTPSETTPTDGTRVPAPQTVTKYVYPQSDPQGYTDLAITIQNASAYGAGQYTTTFMVKNIGTKTSNTWSFFADLPGGEDYVSTHYAALKPQEYMSFTMSSPLPTYTYGEPRATYTVSTAGDTNLQNNTARTAGF